MRAGKEKTPDLLGDAECEKMERKIPDKVSTYRTKIERNIGRVVEKGAVLAKTRIHREITNKMKL